MRYVKELRAVAPPTFEMTIRLEQKKENVLGGVADVWQYFLPYAQILGGPGSLGWDSQAS